MRPRCTWKLRSREMFLGDRTVVMGVLNVTPDSFSDGGKFFAPEKAIEHGLRMLDEGADILDVGGESTRPGAIVTDEVAREKAGDGPVSEPEELQRVLPVIAGILRARPDAVISIDTYKAEVARQATAAGAEIVNDVSGFQWDVAMASACAEMHCGVVLMHTRGKPRQWRRLPKLSNVTLEVEHDLGNRVHFALECGVERARIALDPGFGFGKSMDENYPLLMQLDVLQRLGFPLVAGTSRKSFVGRTVAARIGRDVPPSERLYGSLAAMVVSILRGAHIVRVHDVRAAVEAAAVADEAAKSSSQQSEARSQ